MSINLQQLFMTSDDNTIHSERYPRIIQSLLGHSLARQITTMSFHYLQGLDLLTRVQEQINNIKPSSTNHRPTTQTLYALARDRNSLRMALVAAGEAADKAVTAGKQQRARYKIHASMYVYSGELRISQANACLSHFRYVTALSRHVRIVKEHHESALLSWENLRDHYEGPPDPHACVPHTRQTFFSTQIETVKRTQRLETVYVRWIQLRAAADLKQQAKNFHFTRKQLDMYKRRAENTRRQAHRLQNEAIQRIKEYKHLEWEVQIVEREIQALGNKGGSTGNDGAVKTSVQDENAEQVAQGV